MLNCERLIPFISFTKSFQSETLSIELIYSQTFFTHNIVIRSQSSLENGGLLSLNYDFHGSQLLLLSIDMSDGGWSIVEVTLFRKNSMISFSTFDCFISFDKLKYKKIWNLYKLFLTKWRKPLHACALKILILANL